MKSFRCHLKILRISYKDHATNEDVCARIQQAIRPHEDLLTIVMRHKVQWYGHVSRLSGLDKTILKGTVKGGKDKANRGRGGKQLQGIDRPGAVSSAVLFVTHTDLTTQRPPDHRKETQTAVVWSCLPFIRSGQNHLARHSERGKRKGRQRKRWEDNIREWTGLEFAKS